MVPELHETNACLLGYVYVFAHKCATTDLRVIIWQILHHTSAMSVFIFMTKDEKKELRMIGFLLYIQFNSPSTNVGN